MLIKYNANAYFCGHDHDMQHIHEDNSTVEYFLSGAGHETEDSDDNKVPCTQTFGGSFQLLLKKIKLPWNFFVHMQLNHKIFGSSQTALI